MHSDFETAAGWSAIGPAASIRVTHEPGQTHSGTSALALTYEVKRGQIAAAVTAATPALAACSACDSG